jgi:hypothetical protein
MTITGEIVLRHVTDLTMIIHQQQAGGGHGDVIINRRKAAAEVKLQGLEATGG